jgi:hypothetical protein
MKPDEALREIARVVGPVFPHDPHGTPDEYHHADVVKQVNEILAATDETEGKKLVDGERQKQYGDPVPNMKRIAEGWSILIGTLITSNQVPLMMIWLKMVRENENHLDANVDDIEGYAEILRRVMQT